jgi:carbonic anhydrase
VIATPDEAWQELLAGNGRFIAGTPEHPRQDEDSRHRLASGQSPRAAIFGCSDSRVPAETIFDLGLGDAFVVRNAGQVLSNSVVGSLEYAVAVLRVPLIVVLSHESCGAVRAAIDSQAENPEPLPPHIAELIAPIVPSVRRVAGAREGDPVDPSRADATAVGAEHLRSTVGALLESSELIAAAVADGSLAIASANYRLAEGRVEPGALVGIT